MKLQIDNEFRDLIPPLSAEEYKQLEENIKAEGCRDSLVVWKGIIIDGHNRYKICTANSIEYKVDRRDFKDRAEVVVWMLKNQLGRRNLNDFQRNEVALKFQDAIAAQMKERQATSTGGSKPQLRIDWSEAGSKFPPTTQRSELAKIAGTSEGSIYRSKQILEKGTPDQIERARKGGKGNSIDAISREIRADQETRVCDDCGKELPISYFRNNTVICKHCQLEINRKMKALNDEELKATLFAEDKPGVYSVEMVIGELEANYRNAINVLDGTLERNKDVVISSEENNKKIMAALTNAEAAIVKLKGKYLL